MALYQESFKLVNGAVLDFIEINAALEKRTGLNSDVELLDDSTAIFSNKDLRTEVEAQVKDEHLYLYFSPRTKKNYYENCLLSVFSSFLDQPPQLPDQINKQWKDLSFLDKVFNK